MKTIRVLLPIAIALLDTEVVMTIVGGRMQYRDGEIVRQH